MCGIAGVVDYSESADLTISVSKMLDTLHHRGPDSKNICNNKYVALGATILTTVGSIGTGKQPLSDPTDRFIMVFNGVIYNYKELRYLLSEFEINFDSDTEVLLASWCKWKFECVKYLKGIFSFAVWDRELHTLSIVRDSLGVKPLYYCLDGDRFIFSSEIRAILSVKESKNRVNKLSLFNYLKYQSVVSSATLIYGIKQLEAGHYLVYDKAEIIKSRYYNITDNFCDSSELSYGAITQKVSTLLYQAVERRTAGGLPIGIFLSGGIDSTAIAAIAKQLGKKDLTAFTLSVKEKKYDEAFAAAETAKTLGINHVLVPVDNQDLLHSIHDAIDAMDSPSADGINTYLISKALKNESIRIAISGIGGDELFAGYNYFKYFKLINNYQHFFKTFRSTGRFISRYYELNAGLPRRINSLLTSNETNIQTAYPVFREIISEKAIFDFTNFHNNGEAIDLIGQQLAERYTDIQKFPLLS
jgi:asparagine synthase (glutamine-hydrolysing)